MFDPTTAALIRAAPPLEGLDLENLPKRLTEAFADIVSARIRLRGALADAEDAALATTVAELRRIAAAHETYAALLPDRENRASAAFVAASAHQAVSLALRGVAATSHVEMAAISSEICATLLFLLAEAHADAAEAANRIIPATDAGPIERALLLAIRGLAQGRLGEVIGAGEPEIDAEGDDLGLRALDALRLLLLRGVTNLARQLRLRVHLAPGVGGVVPASTLFAQSFNTTTSMGRLTLNVLLSFAQFEREVTGERIRDKIAASKAKGMWMGGPVPLGYDLADRKLVINEAEAVTVRHINSRYLELGSGNQLAAELEREGIRSKLRVDRHGREYGNQPLSRGGLYAILQNRLYVGDVTHKQHVYPGQHPPIVDRAVFDAVQEMLGNARVERRTRVNAREASLLTGVLYDGLGRRMSPSHANKAGKRYRYYVSQVEGAQGQSQPTYRVSAAEIEKRVIGLLIQLIEQARDHAIAASDTRASRYLHWPSSLVSVGHDSPIWSASRGSLPRSSARSSMGGSRARSHLGVCSRLTCQPTGPRRRCCSASPERSKKNCSLEIGLLRRGG